MSLTMLLAILSLLRVSMTAATQEPDSPATTDAAAAPADVAAVNAAIKAALARSVAFLASASEDGDGESVTGVRVQSSDAREFAGKLEVQLTKDGELIAVSSSTLPEVVVYDSGKRRLTRTTVEDEPLSVAHLSQDLGMLLETQRVLAAFESGATLTETADGRSITCALPKQLFPPPTGIAAMARPKIKAASLSVTLKPDASLAALHLRVTRSNPFAAIRKRIMSGSPPKDGSVALTIDDLDQDEDNGVTSDYELKVQTGPASQRTQDLLEALRKLATMD